MKLLLLWVFIFSSFYTYGFCIEMGSFVVHPDGSHSTTAGNFIYPEGTRSIKVRGFIIYPAGDPCTRAGDFVFDLDDDRFIKPPFVDSDDNLFMRRSSVFNLDDDDFFMGRDSIFVSDDDFLISRGFMFQFSDKN